MKADLEQAKRPIQGKICWKNWGGLEFKGGWVAKKNQFLKLESCIVCELCKTKL